VISGYLRVTFKKDRRSSGILRLPIPRKPLRFATNARAPPLNRPAHDRIVIDRAKEKTQSTETLRRYAPMSDHLDHNG